jgi:hypothetical protein
VTLAVRAVFSVMAYLGVVVAPLYANGDWDGVAFREELERLEGRMNLTVVHAPERVHTERFDMV